MSRKLHTKAGAAVYAARKGIVEPVIGQIKHARGIPHPADVRTMAFGTLLTSAVGTGCEQKPSLKLQS